MTANPVLALLGFLLFAIAGCSTDEPCGVPGVVETCACGGSPGARVCQKDKTWRACDCSGSIALPNAVVQVSGSGGSGAGGTSAGSGGGSGTATSGSGGRAGSSGASGAGAGMPDGGGGMPPMAGEGGAAGEAGSAGAGTGGAGAGAGGEGGAAGSVSPDEAYRGCATAADCDPGARCTITAGFPTSSYVCAPACVDVAECPVPEGDYEATVLCQTGYCQLDCTPVLFAPLLSCPVGMSCIAPTFGVAICHDDGT
jgi:hypothetical protein